MKLTRLSLRPKLSALVGLVLLSIIVVKLHQVPPAAGYEISVYQAYPWYFWGALVGTMLLGQSIIISCAQKDEDDDQSWIWGLGLIGIANAVLLFLPYIRGYAAYGRADLLSHLGYIHDLTALGASENLYPFIHLLTYSLSNAMGTEPISTINLLSPVFSYLLLGGAFYITVHVFETKSHILFCLPFIALLFAGSAHVNTAPYILAIFYVPFILYLLIKGQQTNAVAIRVLLVISVIGVVIYHPLTTAFLLVVFLVYLVLKRINLTDSISQPPTTVTSITLVVFSAWYLNFAGVVRRFEFIADSLLGSAGGQSELGAYADTANTYSPPLFDLIQIGIFRYGFEALLLTLAGIFVLVAGYLWIRGAAKPNLFVLLFAGSFLLFTGLSVLFLLADLIVGFSRPLLFATIFAVILCGSLYYYLWGAFEGTSYQPLVSGTLGCILVVLVVLVVFSVYPIPGLTGTNHHVTEAEVQGTEWLFENRDEEVLIEEFGIRQHRFSHLHYGTTNTSPTIRRENTVPPRRFGYEENETFGANYDRDRYLILTQRGKTTYPEQYPEFRQYWRYTPEDFDRLEVDPSVSRIYDNGVVESYRTTTSER